MLNFNCFLENLPSMDELNFTNFVSERVIGGTSYCCCSYCYFCKFTFTKLLILVIAASPEGASYCCFRKAASNNFFHKVLLTNFISTYVNLLQHFCPVSTDRRLWKVCSTKGASHCSFCIAVKNNYLGKFFLVNFNSPFYKLLQYFIFSVSMLIEGYGKCALRSLLLS